MKQYRIVHYCPLFIEDGNPFSKTDFYGVERKFLWFWVPVFCKYGIFKTYDEAYKVIAKHGKKVSYLIKTM